MITINWSISKTEAENIFKEYETYVYRTALFISKSRSLADDITQDTFIKVFASYERYDQTRPLKPWIYQITMNVAKNHLKKQKLLRMFPFFIQETKHDYVNSIETKFIQSKELQYLWKYVCELSDKSREMIILHFYLELTLKEVSEIIHIPVGTCKSRLNTALNQLRKKTKRDEFSFLREEFL